MEEALFDVQVHVFESVIALAQSVSGIRVHGKDEFEVYENFADNVDM